MTALAECSGLRNLTTLNLTYNRMEPDGLELLANSPRLKQLETFKSDVPPEDD
jgi:hypothetical protein